MFKAPREWNEELYEKILDLHIEIDIDKKFMDNKTIHSINNKLEGIKEDVIQTF